MEQAETGHERGGPSDGKSAKARGPVWLRRHVGEPGMFLICGEALYDVMVDEEAERSSGNICLTAIPGGSPFNVAIGLARLGCNVGLATELAQDALGHALKSRLLDEGVDGRFLRETAAATALAMVDVALDGTPSYAFHGLKSTLFHPDEAKVKANIHLLTGVHVGSIPIVSDQSSGALLALVSGLPEAVIVSFDPNVRLAIEPDKERWRDRIEAFRRVAHIIKVSEEDLQGLYGDDCDLEAIVISWLSDRCSLVALTRGSAGATFFSKSGGQVFVAPVSIKLVDTVGAGDSFQAALLAWLVDSGATSIERLNGLSFADLSALGAFAARAAAITCSRQGPDLPTRADLKTHRTCETASSAAT